MKKSLVLAALLALLLPALAIADSYETVPGTSLAAKWDVTTGKFVSLGVNGQPTSQTVIPIANSVGQTVAATSSALTASTSSATLAPITGLSVPVLANATYDCVGFLYTTSGASGGAQVAFAGSGGMTATSAVYKAALSNTTTASAVTTAMSTTTTFGTGIGVTAAVSAVQIDGSVVVATGGNLIVQGAQNASNGTATDFLAGSNLNCVRTN